MYMNAYHTMIDKHERELESINAQRRIWLYASSVVFTVVVVIIFVLNIFPSATLWWVVFSIGLIITINWWFWTMRVVNTMITHKRLESIILKSIIDDLITVKSQIIP